MVFKVPLLRDDSQQTTSSSISKTAGVVITGLSFGLVFSLLTSSALKPTLVNTNVAESSSLFGIATKTGPAVPMTLRSLPGPSPWKELVVAAIEDSSRCDRDVSMNANRVKAVMASMNSREKDVVVKAESAVKAQASAKAHLIARAEAAEPLFKLGDIVSHKERGQGTVVMVDPVIQVKFVKDPTPQNRQPISYTDEAGKPLPVDEIKAKLTFVKSARVVTATATGSEQPKGFLKAGQLAPMGFFDPAGLSAKVGEDKLLFYREAEIKHGRVCMVATVGILAQEKFHTFFPNIDVPAAKLLDFNYNEGSLQGLWAGAFFVLGLHEIVFDIMGGNGAVPKSPSYVPEPGVQPGDLGWDPLNIKPKTPEKLIEMQNKELNNGRLAMFAALGMIAQEMVTDKKIF